MREGDGMLRSLAVMVGAACWLGCSGTETGNPVLSASVSFYTFSSMPSNISLGSQVESRLAVQRAWINLPSLRWRREGACDRAEPEARDVDETPGFGLLSFGQNEVANVTVQLPANRRYCGVEVVYRSVAEVPAGAPGQLQESAVVFEVAPADGQPTLLRSGAEHRALLRPADGGLFDAASLQVAIAADVQAWLLPSPGSGSPETLDPSAGLQLNREPMPSVERTYPWAALDSNDRSFRFEMYLKAEPPARFNQEEGSGYAILGAGAAEGNRIKGIIAAPTGRAPGLGQSIQAELRFSEALPDNQVIDGAATLQFNGQSLPNNSPRPKWQTPQNACRISEVQPPLFPLPGHELRQGRGTCSAPAFLQQGAASPSSIELSGPFFFRIYREP